MKRIHKTIAPRLASGDSRVSFGHGLPEEIKEGIRRIATKENKSMSWVMEEIIIQYFGFREPKYVKSKTQSKTGNIPDKSRTSAISGRSHSKYIN